MGVFVIGFLGMGVFYLIILAVGIRASRLAKDNSDEEMMLAGRRLGFGVGALTLIATWVGGGYVNGASEVLFDKGLLWAEVPVGYSLALFVGALLFIKPLRDMNCVTLLDPFQSKYGEKVGSLLFLPCVAGDFFWVASILNALGSALMVITDIDPVWSVIISAIFVAAYTGVGAMYSVTYTDVIQIFFIMFGLILSAPFTTANAAYDVEKLKNSNWIGEIKNEDIWLWLDTMALLILGGIPWQGYMQRILAIKSTKAAQALSMMSMIGCMLMAIPACFLGVVARGVTWENVPSFNRSLTEYDTSTILPLVLRHLTPEWVAFFGLGSISAAMMSSADSSVLAFSSIFSRNIYRNLIRPKAGQKESAWVFRATICLISALSALIALIVPSITYLAILSSDLIYVILFPQLLLVVYFRNYANSYGSLTSFVIGLLVRLLGGEQGLGIPPFIKYPGFDNQRNLQKFPHRTFAMLISLLTHIAVSLITKGIFEKRILSTRWDFLKCFQNTINDDEMEPEKSTFLLKNGNNTNKA